MVALWTTHWPIGVFIRISQLLTMEWTHMPPRVLVVNMDFHRKHYHYGIRMQFGCHNKKLSPSLSIIQGRTNKFEAGLGICLRVSYFD